MEKNIYLETASRFIEAAMDEIVRTAPNPEFERERKLTDEEKQAVMEAVERQQPEGKEFAGIQIRHMEPQDGREKPNLAINVINKNKDNALDVTTLYANISEKNGVESYYINGKNIKTQALEEVKASKSLAENANLFAKKQPEIVKSFVEDVVKQAKEIDLDKAVSEEHLKNLEKIKAQGVELEDMLEKMPPEKLAEMNFSKTFDGYLKAMAENIKTEPEKDVVKSEKVAKREPSLKPGFDITKHMKEAELAKLEALPKKTRDALVEHLNKSIPAKDIDKDDSFTLTVMDEGKDRVIAYLIDEKNQASQLMGVALEKGEVVKGECSPYNAEWKDFSEQMRRRNAEIIVGVGAIDKTLEKGDIKDLQKSVKEDLEKPVESRVEEKSGKLLTKKEYDDPAVFNAHLEGKMAELQALLRNAEVNGFDEKSVACVRDCVDGINHELQTVNNNQASNDKILQQRGENHEENRSLYSKVGEYIHENANTVKRFGARTLENIGDSIKVAVAHHMTNRDTRAELDDEYARQQARRFYAVDYSAAKLDIARANKEINKIEEKYAKILMHKNNSFLNRLRGKTFTLKDVMPESKYKEIRMLQRIIAAKEADLIRIRECYSKSLEVSRERLTEMKETRREVGLEDRGLDKKLDKKLENVKNDKGLDRDDDMERER